MTHLLRTAPLGLLAALAAAPAAARPDDNLPTPPKSGTIVTAGQDKVTVAAARQRSANNLKQIGLAFHGYHDAYGFFPAGLYDSTGKKAGLSWRVAILPFIEELELYKLFKLDEPWDSDHNKKLIARMPKVYAPPKGAPVANGLTYYRTFSGPGTVMPPPTGGKAGAPVAGVKLIAITDGTSNTILAAEAADPIIWTKPDELAYDPANPTPKLGGLFEGGANVGLCDGSVRYVSGKIDDKTLRALITANGGEIVP